VLDCRHAKLPDEVVICRDDQLATLDLQMVGIFGRYRALLKGRELRSLLNDQTFWLEGRNACRGNASCIRAKYEQRISYLLTHAPDVCSGPILTQPKECDAGGQYGDREAHGREAQAQQLEPATSQPSVVDGLGLGGHVRFESEAYKQYQCTPSEKFPGFTWCHKEKTERMSGGEVTSTNSILHSQDGTAVYVNRYIEPAVFGQNEIRGEIDRLSAKSGERAREIRMPPREGLPNAVIAVWGKIGLEQLDVADVSKVAAGGSHKGLLVSFLGDLQRSAKAGVPIYKLAGGAGFLWAATFNQNGRGVLRFLAVDTSRIESPVAALNAPALSPPVGPPQVAAPASPPVLAPPPSNGTDYAKIGWWSITHEAGANLSGCSATAQFADQTILELALVQSNTGKGWAIFISNHQWDRWILTRSQHRLWVVTTKPWGGVFDVSED
jgi:uncharacterized protein